MKKLNFRLKMFLTLAVMFIACSQTMALLNYRHNMSQLLKTLANKMHGNFQLVPKLIQADAEGLGRGLAGFGKVEGLARLFVAGDRAGLLAAARPYFEEIKANNNITHMYFIQPDGSVFLRVHKPQMQGGNKLAQESYRRSVETKRLAHGIEMGKHFFSLRAVQPLFLDGRLIGYMELAQEIDSVFRSVRQVSGDDVGVFINKAFLQSKAATVKKEEAGNFVLLESTARETALRLAAKIDLNRGLTGPVVEIVRLGDRRYAVGLGPMKDGPGETAGVLFFQSEVTSLYREMWWNIHSASIFLVVLLLLAMAGIYLVFFRSVIQPLRNGVALVDRVSHGDVTATMDADEHDELGQLVTALNRMTASFRERIGFVKKIAAGDLRQEVDLLSEQDQFGIALNKMRNDLSALVREMRTSGQQVAAASRQVADSGQTLSQGAAQNASALEEISSVMNEIAAQTKNNAEYAGQADRLAREAKDAAEEGNREMAGMSKAMYEISTSSQDISKIIKVIDEIAFQTNLLALNAAVEAARAGQHGKGFAVVAEEVRNLAARSAKAAQETAVLIEGSVDKTGRGLAIADKTAASLERIVSGVTKVCDLVSDIATSSTEQAKGIDEVSRGISQIDQVTQQNTMTAEQSASASEELSAQAGQLQDMLERFQLQNAGQGLGPALLPPGQ